MKGTLFLQLISVAILSALSFVSAVSAVVQQAVWGYCLFWFAVSGLCAFAVKSTLKELRK